ncbi:hypothetical protein [Nocardia neocaledoniensis]|uniref:hypothetical protein n=1 Tax=Nocardia neocaledoniensis TaxID=236511 RepID=UPI002456FB79|nr:hypothetical protein [Nocardia neocaledoniensis]
MTRILSKTVATAAIILAIGTVPAVAIAAPPTPSADPVIGGQPTPPFDPICPLCFIREAIESLSAA